MFSVRYPPAEGCRRSNVGTFRSSQESDFFFYAFFDCVTGEVPWVKMLIDDCSNEALL